MRHIALLLFLLKIFSAPAQSIANSGFESWTANGPNSWGTFVSLNTLFAKMAVRDTVDVFSGKASLRLRTDTVQLPWDNQERLYPGMAIYGSVIYNAQLAQVRLFGTPFTARPDSFRIALKYFSEGNDTAFVSFNLFRNGQYTGGYGPNKEDGFLLPSGGATSWQVFQFPVNYYSDSLPDTLKITLLSSNKNPVLGSTLWVDSIVPVYGLVDGWNEANALVVRVLPNPVNDHLQLLMNDNRVRVLELSGMDGRVLFRKEVSGNESVPMGGFTSGFYGIRIIENGSLVYTGKLVKED